MKRIIVLAVLAFFAVVDAIAWVASHRAATAPAPEEVARAAAAPTPLTASSVERRGDGLSESVSLNGPWLYRQTGSEMSPDVVGADLSNPAVGSARSDQTRPYSAPDLDTAGWRTMELPQNWYLTGLNYHGVIWFRREFTADPAWRGRAVQLRFGGVDYFADVWLNGQKLGRHVGYFQPFGFDVTGLLNYGGRNVVAVRVESPYEEYDTVWPNRKTLIKGIFQHSNVRPGGAWSLAGQEYNTGGIWDDVSLLVSDYLTVEAVQLRATWPTTVTVGAESRHLGVDPSLSARITIRNHADAPAQATVRLTLTPRNFEGKTDGSGRPVRFERDVTLPAGPTTVEITGTVQNPVLWWPWDRGQPNLYTARVEVLAGTAVPKVTGLRAQKEIAFGFRQISVGEDWAWTLNGQRFFPRGTNYVSSLWLSETNREWFRRDLQLIRDANLNFIRLPAHVEPEAFYEVADELGLLVWQDFPLQWGYTDAPAFVDEAQRQMAEMVELLYNHPSIVVWCGHNEPPWEIPDIRRRAGGDARSQSDGTSQNRRLDELLRETAVKLDPTRPVFASSGGSDKHIYAGWDSGSWQDYSKVPGAPMVTEFGAQALPGLSMLEKTFAPEELTYQSGEVRTRWEFHDFQPRSAFDVAKIRQTDPMTTTDLITATQAYQANLLKFAAETYRRARYEKVQGIFQYLFADPWPAISWSVVDYDRQPKAGYYALQTAMQPVLPSIAAALPAQLDGDRWVYNADKDLAFTFWVVNDTLNRYTAAQLRWRIVQEDGEVTVLLGDQQGDIGPDEAQPWAAINKPVIGPGQYTLKLELTDAAEKVLGRNAFKFAVTGK